MFSFRSRSTAVLAVAGAILIGASAAHAQSTSRNLILPFVGSAPETGLQYGATAYRLEHLGDSATRATSYQLFASSTAKSQLRAYFELDRWTTRNDWHFIGHIEWERFPLTYFGTGDRTPKSAEEAYTPRGIIGWATVQRRVAGPLYVLAGYRFQDLDIVKTTPDGALRDGSIRGSRGSRVGQLQAGALWDSRDDAFAPYTGTFVQVTGSLAANAFGSAFDFRRLVLDARHFVSLGGRRVLAFQGVYEGTGGAAPFDQVSLVGNSSYLRGYATGRYRDMHLATIQAELRAPIIGRLSGAAFAGAGRIAPRASDLTSSSARTLPSYGGGVRWQLFAGSRNLIRLDYARGVGQSGIYLGLNEAF
ncbi:MAG: outer membrane protein assembly factor [Gemmatimonadota bacterium]|nr:outer membrane protein assembly factor [Gemmatimonadota bacterium]